MSGLVGGGTTGDARIGANREPGNIAALHHEGNADQGGEDSLSENGKNAPHGHTRRVRKARLFHI
jgi:hypothetical protein